MKKEMEFIKRSLCLILTLAFVLGGSACKSKNANDVSDSDTWTIENTAELKESNSNWFTWSKDKTTITGLTQQGYGQEEYVFPSKCEKITGNAFLKNENLKRVAFANPDTIFDEDFAGFSNCINLAEIRFPDSLMVIPPYCCYGCERLTSITFPSYLDVIEESAFEDCSSLRTVILPNQISRIEYAAFRNCRYLSELKLGTYLQGIGVEAFSMCSSLRNVELPYDTDNLVVGEDAFEETPYLSEANDEIRQVLLGRGGTQP